MAAKEETSKKLFLVDAMAHIYRAFYAPMMRLNAPSGIPSKVPFLFSNIVRRLLKDYKPDYIGIVFDTSKPDGTPRKLMSNARLGAMGWAPSISLEDVLASTYQWFLEQEQVRV